MAVLLHRRLLAGVPERVWLPAGVLALAAVIARRVRRAVRRRLALGLLLAGWLHGPFSSSCWLVHARMGQFAQVVKSGRPGMRCGLADMV
jgi:hypothetical protein